MSNVDEEERMLLVQTLQGQQSTADFYRHDWKRVPRQEGPNVLGLIRREVDVPDLVSCWLNQRCCEGFIQLTSLEKTMSNNKQDGARVAGGRDHEVRYEAHKEDVSKGEVKKAVKEVGNSREAVEKKLAH